MKIIRQLVFILISTVTMYVAARAEPCNVISVIDGDSMMVSCPSFKGALGLTGVDAPELPQAYGENAADFLEVLLGDGKVTISDIIPSESRGSVFLADGKNVNAMMIMSGYAWSKNRADNSSNYRLALEGKAKAEKVGMWVSPNNTPPWEYRQANHYVDDEDKGFNQAVLAMRGSAGESGTSGRGYSSFTECYDDRMSGLKLGRGIGSLAALSYAQSEAALVCGAEFGKKVTITKRKMPNFEAERKLDDMSRKVDDIDRKLKYGY